MRIAIVTPGTLPVPPVKGGAVENLIYTIIKENELSKNPIKIDIFSIEDKNMLKTKKEDNTKYIYVNNHQYKHDIINKILFRIEIKFNKSRFVNNIIKLMKKNKYDWVIVENRPQYILQLKKKIDSKIILHMHNEHLTSYRNYSKAISACDKIFVVSNYIKETILRKYNIREDNIKVLHNGIDIDRFSIYETNKKRLLRQNYNLKDEDFVIIFSGRLVKEKGILEVLQAFNNINSIYNVKLLVIGASWFSSNSDNNFVKQLKNVAYESRKNIIFTGYIDYDKIHNIYNMGDIAVLPSIWNDPFPLTILECMAVGLPVISTESGGIPEMIDRECGILLPIDEKIIENLCESIKYLINNKVVREKMRKLSREKIELKFSNKIFYDNFISLLKLED